MLAEAHKRRAGVRLLFPEAAPQETGARAERAVPIEGAEHRKDEHGHQGFRGRDGEPGEGNPAGGEGEHRAGGRTKQIDHGEAGGNIQKAGGVQEEAGGHGNQKEGAGAKKVIAGESGGTQQGIFLQGADHQAGHQLQTDLAPREDGGAREAAERVVEAGGPEARAYGRVQVISAKDDDQYK